MELFDLPYEILAYMQSYLDRINLHKFRVYVAPGIPYYMPQYNKARENHTKWLAEHKLKSIEALKLINKITYRIESHYGLQCSSRFIGSIPITGVRYTTYDYLVATDPGWRYCIENRISDGSLELIIRSVNFKRKVLSNTEWLNYPHESTHSMPSDRSVAIIQTEVDYNNIILFYRKDHVRRTLNTGEILDLCI